MVETKSISFLRILLVLAGVCLAGLPIRAQYSGGTGEPNDPYQIATAADLILLGGTPTDYDKHFVLTADIDLDPNLSGRRVFDKAVISSVFSSDFCGVFDGNGHVISHVVIRSQDSHAGLFAYVAAGATIRDLGVAEVSVTSSNNYVGGLAGSNLGAVINCYSTGAISGGDYVGGLIGYNYQGSVNACHSQSEVNGHAHVGGLVGTNIGAVTNCHSAGTVKSSYWNAGGLVGWNAGGTIINCFAANNVVGQNWVGGLVGEHSAEIIADCHATGEVVGDDAVGGLTGINRNTMSNCYATGGVTGCGAVGGLVAVNYDVVVNCYSTGPVQGDDYVGGLVGYNPWDAISSSYSTGAVDGRDSVGGLVGYNGGTVINAYSLGSVTGSDGVGGLAGRHDQGVLANSYSVGPVTGNADKVGGLVGERRGAVFNCFWNVDTAQQAASAGGRLSTTAEMQDPATFLKAGWDFVGEQKNGPGEIWQMPAEGGYPVLTVFQGYLFPQLDGDGSPDHPYLVSKAEDLGMVQRCPTACFRVVSDMDLSGRVWSMGAIPVFAGSFDGQHHRITNLKISGSGCLGFFGYLGGNGRVLDLSVENAEVSAERDWVGALVGFNHGTVLRCSANGIIRGSRSVGVLVGENWGWIPCSCSRGTVKGSENVGGLAGINHAGIESSFSTASVAGSCAGGLVGFNEDWGTIMNSYSRGSVVGGLTGGHTGGLVGSNDGSVSNAYSAGDVSGGGYFTGGLIGWNTYRDHVTNSFWDIETSGRTSSDAGLGKTKAEMQAAGTFEEAGWDFVGETANGTKDIWWIEEGKDYPRLWWELPQSPAPE